MHLSGTPRLHRYVLSSVVNKDEMNFTTSALDTIPAELSRSIATVTIISMLLELKKLFLKNLIFAETEPEPHTPAASPQCLTIVQPQKTQLHPVRRQITHTYTHNSCTLRPCPHTPKPSRVPQHSIVNISIQMDG